MNERQLRFQARRRNAKLKKVGWTLILAAAFVGGMLYISELVLGDHGIVCQRASITKAVELGCFKGNMRITK